MHDRYGKIGGPAVGANILKEKEEAAELCKLLMVRKVFRD